MGLLSKLSPDEQEIEERLRTLALCLCALCAVGFALYWLRAILVPLVLAIALRYLLQPLIDCLSVRPLRCRGMVFFRERARCDRAPSALRPCLQALLELRLPYYISVCISIIVAFATLGLLGFIVADSVHVFSSHADVYSLRVQELALGAMSVMNRWQEKYLGPMAFTNSSSNAPQNGSLTLEGATVQSDGLEVSERLRSIVKAIPVTSLVVNGLKSLMEAVSNLFLVRVRPISQLSKLILP